MATTGIWKIQKRLDHVINYTTNVEKTINYEYANTSYNELHNVIDYIEAEYKTEKQYFVTGINCSVKTAREEMMMTKKQFNKTDGILGFHAFQSFKESEVTPDIAHAIGIKLAEEMWGDRFEVLVSTHINTKNIHNHFVINSVSFVDGKKYYDKRETYAKIRNLSDCICEEFGISFLKEKQCKKSKINYNNYYKKSVENSSYYDKTKEDIDLALKQAYSYRDFENLLRKMNYQLYYRYGKLSVRGYPYNKNIRIVRAYGEEYGIDNIKSKINNKQSIKHIEKNYDSFITDIMKTSKLYRLYLHYCYILNVFQKEYPNKRLPVSIRIDVKKMDNISKEARLLDRYKINTYEQFLCFKKEKKTKLDSLKDKREKLWYKHKITNEKETVKLEIHELTKDINLLKKEVVLCEAIEKRVHKIKNNINELYEENSNERGEKENEFIK